MSVSIILQIAAGALQNQQRAQDLIISETFRIMKELGSGDVRECLKIYSDYSVELGDGLGGAGPGLTK